MRHTYVHTYMLVSAWCCTMTDHLYTDHNSLITILITIYAYHTMSSLTMKFLNHPGYKCPVNLYTALQCTYSIISLAQFISMCVNYLFTFNYLFYTSQIFF